jgi:hypothetical protein
VARHRGGHRRDHRLPRAGAGRRDGRGRDGGLHQPHLPGAGRLTRTPLLAGLLGAVLLAALLAGCTGEAPEAAGRPGPTAGVAATTAEPGDEPADPPEDEAEDDAEDEPEDEPEDGERLTQADARRPFDEACRLAGDGWCDDRNGNGWPDRVELAAGHDLDVDGCAVSDCPGGAIDELLVSLQDNTLFILDASGSMAGDAGGGQTKMVAAKEALVAYAQGAPAFADLGLMVYGHRGDSSDAGRAESCAGIEVTAEVGSFGPDTAAQAVAGFEATGWTPIGAALEAAGPVLERAADADAADGVVGATNRIILISDGLETCDGDPVGAAEALVGLGVEVVVDVIGFDLGEADRAALEQVAGVTGGRYVDARTGQALRDVLAAHQQQIYDAVGVIQCQRGALADFVTCRTSLSGTYIREMYDEAATIRADGDRERADFIGYWATELSADAYELTEARRTELDAQLQRLLAEVEAAAARRSAILQGAEGEAVSRAAVDCPYLDGPAVA